MDNLRSDILALQIRNYESRAFIPFETLFRLMSQDRVRKVIDLCDVPVFRKSEMVEIAIRGARRILAILVVMRQEKNFLRFIETDHFRLDGLDSRLPLPLTELSKILETTAVAKEFFDVQWTFIPPEFKNSAIHRSLDADTILPFIGEPKDLGEGSFGVVTEVLVPREICQSVDYHGFSEISTNSKDMRTRSLVRKEFKLSPGGESQATYGREESNLHILCRLKHPNIMPLISSYRFRGKTSFLFPRASGGTLHDFLRNDDRPAGLTSEEDILYALCGLCSAIDTVHCFSISELDLRMIGCHHDIKPRNILMDDNKFILADFGLARLKMATESSESDFVTGPRSYLAPECEDAENDYEKHSISRPSDIWSFGCILLELLTYLVQGSDGVVAFQQRRKIKIGNRTTSWAFHAGYQKKHPGVVSWMAELEHQLQYDRPHLVGLLLLIREMLSIVPSERPRASAVLYRMRHLYVAFSYNTILKRFDRRMDESYNYELKIEHERFSIWGRILELKPTLDVNLPIARILSPDLAFEPMTSSLKETILGLYRITVVGSEAIHVAQQALIDTIDALYDLLPVMLRQKCQALLEQRLLAAANAEELSRAEGLLQSTLPYRRIGMLAAIKRMTLLANSRKVQCRPDLELEGGLTRCTENFGDHAIGLMTSNCLFEPRGREVLMEMVRYDLHWEGPVTEEMMVRIEAIAEMHSQEDKPTDLRSLQCIGYFHQAEKHAFCIVYDFPLHPESDGETTKVYNLNRVLVLSQRWKERPFLENRYRLALKLATSIFEFHTVDWLHKNFSAYNVIFFNNEPRKGTSELSRIRALEEPFIIGFSRSRPNEPAAYTNGPEMSGESRMYQHPQYAQRKHSYLPHFDYYSLGLVLLEIGHWAPLTDLIAGKKFSSLEDQRLYLLRARVPLLGHSVGKEYMTAVLACLQTFGASTDDTGKDSTNNLESERLDFSEEVLARLRKLAS